MEQFDEIELNRLLVLVQNEISLRCLNRTPEGVPELEDLEDKILQLLEGEDTGCGEDCCGAACICRAR